MCIVRDFLLNHLLLIFNIFLFLFYMVSVVKNNLLKLGINENVNLLIT